MFKDKFAPSTKLDEKLEGIDNFWAWKYRVMLILEENDLENFVKEEVPEPDEDEAKEKYENNLVKENRTSNSFVNKLSTFRIQMRIHLMRIHIWLKP